ncbi:ankyrin [Myriangium duriaei CBS 260.36]|uniref:Ankyrin n=1 Tax=Myriangium duriaei CBS 260.36 TaxID=1168546 RepID=A0A9P4J1Z0_9PEZI|nr:ankyrin [Myriangium duriaei CBS 260.36]
MGVPQATADGTVPSNGPVAPHITAEAEAATAAQPTSSAPSRNVSDLPPAALDLAGKLFDLARDGSTAPLTQYLEAGIPPNLTNHKGDTLLMLASYHGHADTARMLLGKGADPDVLNDRGQSIIAGAVFKDHEEVVKILYEGVNGRKADISLGQPNAIDSAKMFKQEKYLNLFGVENDGVAPWDAAATGRA